MTVDVLKRNNVFRKNILEGGMFIVEMGSIEWTVLISGLLWRIGHWSILKF